MSLADFGRIINKNPNPTRPGSVRVLNIGPVHVG